MKGKLLRLLVIILFLSRLVVFAQDLPQERTHYFPPGKDRISLDIKGMDVIDVFKMISARCGLNIVVGKNVTGRVTLFLKDVDIWDAFEIVLLSNDLAYEEQNGLINVITQRDYELKYGARYKDNKEVKLVQLRYAKAADLSRSLNQIKTNVGRVVVDEGSNTLSLIDTPEKIKEMENFIQKTDIPIQTRIFSLNYAPVDKLGPKLQDAITKGIGSIKIDERSNKIAVTDYTARLDDIAKIISAFDEKTLQVLIDAQIIEITPSESFKMGVDWNYFIEKYFDAKLSLPVTPLAAGGALFLGTLSTATQAGKDKAIIDILQTIGTTKILSSPRIMALNNQEAKIHVGETDYYIASTTTVPSSGTPVTTQTFNSVDSGIELNVTPTINRDGFVTMKIAPTLSSYSTSTVTIGDTVNTVPKITKSDAQTTVMVKDGVTIIIGGLRKDKREKTVNKIPFLGDIPGLGVLFRNTNDQFNKNELVILLTPHIISGETSYSSFNEIKPTDGMVASMHRGKIIGERVVVPKKPAPRFTPPRKDYRHMSKDDYYREISERIQTLAPQNNPQGAKGSVTLLFTVSKEGNVVGDPYILETDNEMLDAAALAALESASPFPAFPNSMQQESESFKISLNYE